MEFLYNLASTSTSVAMIGAVISFIGVGLMILVFSERMLHGLSKLILFLGSQVLLARRLFSQKYIDDNKASKNLAHINKRYINKKDISLAEQKEWLERILKMNAQVKRSDFEV
tara:strand:- start:66 stop:404 length:339 start_codon:yes stop_codon:yes gene_type:complete